MCRGSKRLFRQINPAFYLVLAVMFLTVPISWVLSWLIASTIHELGHYLAIRFCGKRILGISINWNGLIMETEDLGSKQWFCALAGPLFGILLIPFIRWFPRMAVCAFVQSCMNLLPVYPSDGGRFLFAVLSLCLPEMIARRVTMSITVAMIAFLGTISLFVWYRYTSNLFLLSILIVLLVKLRNVRISCKDERLLIQ